MAVKYSPAWYRNQRRLRDLGYNVSSDNTFAGSYGTAGGGLAGVKAAQTQYGPDAYTTEEASQLARTGTIPKPGSSVASLFSSSIPSQQEATGFSSVVTEPSSAVREEPTAVPAKTENFQTMLNELTALNTGTASPSTAPTPTETSPAPAPTPTVTDATRQELIDETLGKKYGGGMSAAELQDFETLIGRLEGSKMRQAGQLNRARQREKYSGGLASMMRNF